MMFQVSSPHPASQTHATSPQVPPPQVTSPPHNQPHVNTSHLFPQAQVTSPHLPHVTSPHFSQPQVTSCHHFSQSQVTSPHLVPQVTSPHLVPQVTSPHLVPQVTSPHLVPQVTSPHLVSQVTSPHLFSPNQDPGLDNPNWGRCELSYLLQSYSYSSQNTAHLDLQDQKQFSTGVTQHTDDLEYSLPCNTHTHSVYGQGDTPGAAQDTWRPLGPTLPQLQCTALGSTSGGVLLERWSSVDFSSSPAELFSGTQFFNDSCHDNHAPQPFYSPGTPGLSPHYPQTSAVSSPSPQSLPREESLDFHRTSRQQSREKSLSYPSVSAPGQLHPHHTSPHLLHSELIQDQERSFLDFSSTAQSPGWREECGGGGGRAGGNRGGGAGGGAQPDWIWVKRPRPQNSTEALGCRLHCTVCKRDFRSLPALNGHMRSHRSATRLNKGEDSFLLVKSPVSMVIPVSVPIQSKTCRSGQRRCSSLSPAAGGAVLYCSLLRRDEAEAVAWDDGAVRSEEAGVEGGGVVAGGDGGGGVHFTPPPMLCPLRVGPGLYCSLTTRRQQRVQTVQLHSTLNGLNDLVAMETASPPPATLTSGINRPRINVGWGFQAEIPPLWDRKYAHSDSHNALLLWTPWDELELPANQWRVEALLTMARCSVVPGGGASPESALRVLSECRGDFLLTVEKLLSTPESSTGNNNTAHQSPAVSWSAAERRLLVKSLQLHQKDFSRIQKAVQTKSLSQCVEFYYLWKKKLSLIKRPPSGLTVTLPDSEGQRSLRSPHAL